MEQPANLAKQLRNLLPRHALVLSCAGNDPHPVPNIAVGRFESLVSKSDQIKDLNVSDLKLRKSQTVRFAGMRVCATLIGPLHGWCAFQSQNRWCKQLGE
jgi:hypothetical protein